MTAIASELLTRVLVRLHGVRTSGDGWVALCPAHDDHDPSLSIREEGDKILLHCFASCDAEQIVESIGLSMLDLFRETARKTHPSRSGRPFVIPEGDIPELLAALEVPYREALDSEGVPYSDCWTIDCPKCGSPARISAATVDGQIGIFCLECERTKRRPSGFWRFTIPQFIRLVKAGTP